MLSSSSSRNSQRPTRSQIMGLTPTNHHHHPRGGSPNPSRTRPTTTTTATPTTTTTATRTTSTTPSTPLSMPTKQQRHQGESSASTTTSSNNNKGAGTGGGGLRMDHVGGGFSQLELVDLERAFRLFDIEGKGVIGIGTFRSVLESLLLESTTVIKDQQGERRTKSTIYPHLEDVLLHLSDRSDEEMMDFDGYLALMASTSLQQRLHSGDDGTQEEESNCQHVFNLFDVDRKGYITVEDLYRTATELGETDMRMEELQEMIDRAASTKTGKVTLKEFSKIMTLNLFQKLDEEAAAAEEEEEEEDYAAGQRVH